MSRQDLMHFEWDVADSGVPFLLGAVLATSVSLGLWLVVSSVSWLVMHIG